MTRKLKAALARAEASLALEWFDIVALHGELKGALAGLVAETKPLVSEVETLAAALRRISEDALGCECGEIYGEAETYTCNRCVARAALAGEQS